MICLGNSLLVIKSKDGTKWKPLSRFIYKTKFIWKATAVQFNVKVKHYFQNGFFFIFTDSNVPQGQRVVLGWECSHHTVASSKDLYQSIYNTGLTKPRHQIECWT